MLRRFLKIQNMNYYLKKYIIKKTYMTDPIFNIINKEKQRQHRSIELIASENFVSPNTIKAVGSILTNKYAEGYPGHRYYGGCEHVDEIENLAIDRAKELFGAKYANVQPHSGSQANMAVYLSVMEPGDKVLGLCLNSGGHLTHGHSVNFSGTLYDSYFYDLDENGIIDYNEIRAKALEVQPKMIICGASAYSQEWDYLKFREIADEVNAILFADISHIAGFVATGLMNNPINHAHICTTTTHKTLRTTRGGMIMMGDDFDNPKGLKTRKGVIRKMSEVLSSMVFPGIQGGPLEHVIAGKAVGFGEALQPEFKDYMLQVRKNTKAMVEEFKKKDYTIVSGGSINHLFLIDLQNKKISGKKAEKLLDSVDITTNKNMVPNDPRSPFVTSGIRIGTSAVTTRGLKEDDCKRIVDLIDRTIENKDNEDELKSIRVDVNEMMLKYELFSY